MSLTSNFLIVLSFAFLLLATTTWSKPSATRDQDLQFGFWYAGNDNQQPVEVWRRSERSSPQGSEQGFLHRRLIETLRLMAEQERQKLHSV